MTDSLAMFQENWQMFATLGTALLIGYTIARRFEKLLGKDKKGRTIVDRLESLEHQMYPNGGSSLTDKIDYVRRDQNKMKEQISEISGEIKVIREIVTVIVDK